VGPKAVYYIGELAEMEQSLLKFALSKVQDAGFTPMAGSELVRSIVAVSVFFSFLRESRNYMYMSR
jgi:seryl-tRNA synthetase